MSDKKSTRGYKAARWITDDGPAPSNMGVSRQANTVNQRRVCQGCGYRLTPKSSHCPRCHGRA